ncbi:Hsp20/alpha crystallin family protein [Natronorubrum sp. A-ect3]|uniref:Hsp20/alpha crystallin family protein n=1 Tax=Natronorubrum sp. A-ect3 TaxID=3242698 RepID=UPI00359CC14F
MTADDRKPDDRSDESTDVPIDDSPSDEVSTAGDDEPDTADSANRQSDDRDEAESRIDLSASESGADDGDDHWLSSLLSALDRLEGGSMSGRRRSDRTVLDYDLSIRSGDDLGDESRFSRDGPDGRGRPSDQDHDRSRTRRRRSSASNAHLTTRRHDDELLVIADVAGTEPDDVTVGFDDTKLVVAVSGRELERIEVPWRERTAEATVTNGVLTVRIEPDAGGDGSTTEVADTDE